MNVPETVRSGPLLRSRQGGGFTSGPQRWLWVSRNFLAPFFSKHSALDRRLGPRRCKHPCEPVWPAEPAEPGQQKPAQTQKSKIKNSHQVISTRLLAYTHPEGNRFTHRRHFQIAAGTRAPAHGGRPARPATARSGTCAAPRFRLLGRRRSAPNAAEAAPGFRRAADLRRRSPPPPGRRVRSPLPFPRCWCPRSRSRTRCRGVPIRVRRRRPTQYRATRRRRGETTTPAIARPVAVSGHPPEKGHRPQK